MKKALYPAAPLLLVDDETQFLVSAAFILKGAGIDNVVTCSDSRRVMALLRGQVFSAVLLDLSLPQMAGTELLPDIVANFPGTPVIIVTASNDAETAVQCLKKGAVDYLVKPLCSDSFLTAVRKVI
jgi:DNA-binding NtrC family response regulator